MMQPDPMAALLAAMDLAEDAPRDEEGNLTDEGKALVQAALDQGKENNGDASANQTFH